MRETSRTNQEILSDILSKDSHKIWKASCNIISLSQNHHRIMEFIPYLSELKEKTKNIELGGFIAPNKRFLVRAFETIEFHMSNDRCPCCLLGEDSNPRDIEADGYVIINDTILIDSSNYIDYYLVQCRWCNNTYRVEEGQYHYTWWNWIPVKVGNESNDRKK